MLVIREASRIEDHELDPLAAILIGVVEAGASIGFLPPLARDEARAYWLDAVTPDIRLVIADNEHGIVGSEPRSSPWRRAPTATTV